MPTILPAFNTIIIAASYEIGKIRIFAAHEIFMVYLLLVLGLPIRKKRLSSFGLPASRGAGI